MPTKYFGVFASETGLPIAYYNDDVFPDVVEYGEAPEPTDDLPNPAPPIVAVSRNPAIPADAVDLSAAEWLELIENAGSRRWDGSAVVEYIPPPPTVDLSAYAKEARDRHENGGITVGGVPVSTDDRSKTLVTGARLRAEKDASLITSWAAADGQVYPLTSAMILAVSDAIGAFVAELFETYADVRAAIAAGSIKTTAEIDARFGALEVAF